MKTTADSRYFWTKPFLEKITYFEFDSEYKTLKVTKNIAVRWKLYYWIYVSATSKGKIMAIEDIGNRIWKVFHRNVI